MLKEVMERCDGGDEGSGKVPTRWHISDFIANGLQSLENKNTQGDTFAQSNWRY